MAESVSNKWQWSRCGSWANGLAIAAAILTTSIGGFHLAAWLSGTMAQRGFSAITMKTNAALALSLSGVALLLLSSNHVGRLTRWTARACATATLLIGAITLVENITGWNLRIDQFLAHEPPGTLGVTSPNRFGLPASTAFILASIALLLQSRSDRKWTKIAQTLAVGVCLIALLATLGYLYKVRSLYGLAVVTAIAWPTSTTFLILGLGLLCTRCDVGLMALVTADDPGGAVIRRLLIPAILLPIALGWLRLFAQEKGLYETPLGTALLVLSFIIIFGSLALSAGRHLSRSSAAERSTQKALRESESRFRATYEQAAVGIEMVDLSGRLLHGNGVLQRILGYSEHELSHLTFADITHPDDLPAEQALLDQLLAGRIPRYSIEKRYLRKDGATIWVRVTSSLVHAGDAYRVSIIEDITSQKAAEERLRASERRLRTFFQSDMVGTIYWTTDGKITDANDKFLRMVGYSREDLAAGRMVWAQMTPPEYRHVDDHALSELQATGVDTPYEKQFIRKDGSRVSVIIGAAMLDDSHHEGVAFVLDITDRKRTEQAMLHSEQRYRSFVEASAQIVWTTNARGEVNMDIPAWCNYTGQTSQQALGFGWMNAIDPDDRARVAAAWKKAFDTRGLYEVEYRLQRADGSWRNILARGVPVFEPDGSIREYVGTCIDITDRKQYEEALHAAKLSAEHAKAAAEEANRAKDHFLAVLSHELRTPLTPVVTAVSMLQQTWRCDERTRDLLEMIRRNVEMEARLIDDLLDVTRIVRGKVELDRRPIPLADVLRRAVEVCQPDIEARQLHFGVDIGPCASHVILADAARLQQVFWNLLKNAIKFTPHGGCVGIRCQHNHDGHVIAEINDSGEGIDPATLPHIFNPFEQGGARVTRQFGGLGLGLTITKGLVEMHGGSISAHSPGKGKGATFRIRLPIHHPAHTSPTPKPTNTTPTTPPHKPKSLRILLVEDHGDTARIMRRLLTAEGHQVHIAPDLATALELSASNDPFDLIISDLGLPDGTGLDLLRTLRSRGHTTPAIALSGYGQEDDIRRSHEAGFSAHLTKPTSPDRLSQTIATLSPSP